MAKCSFFKIAPKWSQAIFEAPESVISKNTLYHRLYVLTLLIVTSWLLPWSSSHARMQTLHRAQLVPELFFSLRHMLHVCCLGRELNCSSQCRNGMQVYVSSTHYTTQTFWYSSNIIDDPRFFFLWALQSSPLWTTRISVSEGWR